MQKQLIYLYIILLLLVIGGAAINTKDLNAVMASDAWMYTLRSLLISGWLYAGYLVGVSSAIIRASLFLLGGTYFTIGVLALFNDTVWGVNPHPLMGVELWIHIIYGAAALLTAFAAQRKRK